MKPVAEALIDRVEEFLRIKVVFAVFDFIAMHADGEVLCHLPAFDRFDANAFQCIGEIDQRLIVIQFTRNARPRVQAKIDAMGLVEVGLPAW